MSKTELTLIFLNLTQISQPVLHLPITIYPGILVLLLTANCHTKLKKQNETKKLIYAHVRMEQSLEKKNK